MLRNNLQSASDPSSTDSDSPKKDANTTLSSSNPNLNPSLSADESAKPKKKRKSVKFADLAQTKRVPLPKKIEELSLQLKRELAETYLMVALEYVKATPQGKKNLMYFFVQYCQKRFGLDAITPTLDSLPPISNYDNNRHQFFRQKPVPDRTENDNVISVGPLKKISVNG